MLRFHLDEHVDHGIARALTARGIDVTTTTDADLLSADDDAHLAFARSMGRVIVTNDADFLRVAAQDFSHHGVAFWAPGSRTVGDIVRYLCLMHDCLELDEMVGKVEYL